MGAAARRRVDQAGTGRLEAFQCFFDIVHGYRNVVNAFAAFCHEFFHGRCRVKRFEQLDPAVSHWNHCQIHSLVFHRFIAGNFQAHDVFVDFYGIGQGPHCDSDMIDFHFSNLVPRTISSTMVYGSVSRCAIRSTSFSRSFPENTVSTVLRSNWSRRRLIRRCRAASRRFSIRSEVAFECSKHCWMDSASSSVPRSSVAMVLIIGGTQPSGRCARESSDCTARSMFSTPGMSHLLMTKISPISMMPAFRA